MNVLGVDKWGTDTKNLTYLFLLLLYIILVFGIPLYKVYKELSTLFNQPHKKNVYVILAKVFIIWVIAVIVAEILIEWVNEQYHLDFWGWLLSR
jgi:ABC-type uncharacterized transport system fused permease/ATPase subunit